MLSIANLINAGDDEQAERLINAAEPFENPSARWPTPLWRSNARRMESPRLRNNFLLLRERLRLHRRVRPTGTPQAPAAFACSEFGVLRRDYFFGVYSNNTRLSR